MISVEDGLRVIVGATKFESIFIACGSIYRGALGSVLVDVAADISTSAGPIGVQLSQLKHWLYQPDFAFGPPEPVASAPATQHGDRATMSSTLDDVLQRGREAIANDPAGASRISVWYAVIDGHSVPVKWLLHKLTGRAPNTFTSHTADAAELPRMGVEAHRR